MNNPDLLRYTWFCCKRRNQTARLDFFLVTPEISSKLKETKIVCGYRTVHSALILDLELYEACRGKGFWKWNTSLLYDTEYITLIRQEITNTINQYKIHDVNREDYSIDFRSLFEMINVNVRGQTIPYSIQKAKALRADGTRLEQKIKDYEEKIILHRVSDSKLKIQLETCLNKAKEELEQLREPKVRAAV